MVIGSLIYGDKKLVLSSLNINWPKACKFWWDVPFLPIVECQGKAWWDLTPPTPTHKERMNEKSFTYTHGIIPIKIHKTHNTWTPTQAFILLSNCGTCNCKPIPDYLLINYHLAWSESGGSKYLDGPYLQQTSSQTNHLNDIWPINSIILYKKAIS